MRKDSPVMNKTLSKNENKIPAAPNPIDTKTYPDIN
jgi:hypothetical protein